MVKFFNMWDIIKVTITTVVSGIVSFFLPIHNYWIVIGVLFTINFAAGWRAGAKLHRESFNIDKAFKAISHLVVYFALLAVCFFVAKLMAVKDTVIIDFTSWITWVVIYFYAANITKNAKRIQPDNRTVSFLHYMINIEFIKQIKYLEEYFKYNKNEKN